MLESGQCDRNVYRVVMGLIKFVVFDGIVYINV
jgi:hypothetical protein